MFEIKISLTEELEEKFREVEEKRKMSKEEIVREALQMYLPRILKAPLMNPEILKAVETQEKLALEDSIVWDSSEVLRRWRETK